MKVDKRANLCIFAVIAILALGLSNFAAAYTGDLVMASFPGVNDTDKMIALDDDGFTPLGLNAVYEPKPVVEEVNETDNETDTNSTIEDDDSDDSDDSDTDSNSNSNRNSDSDTNADTDTNDNSGGGNSDSRGNSQSDDSSDDE